MGSHRSEIWRSGTEVVRRWKSGRSSHGYGADQMVAKTLTLVAAVLMAGSLLHAAPAPVPDIRLGDDGKLQYVATDRADRIPDFSTCGYMTGGIAIPDAPVRVIVTPVEGDNTARIQNAI